MLLSGNALSVEKDQSVPPKAERHRFIQEARPAKCPGDSPYLARQRLQKSYPYLLCNLDKAAIWNAMLFTKWTPCYSSPWPSGLRSHVMTSLKSAIV